MKKTLLKKYVIEAKYQKDKSRRYSNGVEYNYCEISIKNMLTKKCMTFRDWIKVEDGNNFLTKDIISSVNNLIISSNAYEYTRNINSFIDTFGYDKEDVVNTMEKFKKCKQDYDNLLKVVGMIDKDSFKSAVRSIQ